LKLMNSYIEKIDCKEGIKKLEDDSVNLVVTSPPYNLGDVSIHNHIKYNTYKDNKDYGEYIKWLKDIFGLLFNKMTEDGRICINIGDQKNGAIPTHWYIMDFMFKLGYGYFTTIIWNKSQTARRTAWGCYSDDVNVLTSNGLKLFRDVNILNDEFATLNLNTKELEYQKATHYIEKVIDEEIFDIKSKTIDLSVTKCHNMLYQHRDKNNSLDLMESNELFKQYSITIPKKVKYSSGKKEDWFYLPKIISGKRCKKYLKEYYQKEVKIDMNLWLKFLGIFLTDGNCYYSEKRGSYKTSIYQVKEKFMDEIKEVLGLLPFEFKYKKNKNEFHVCDKRLASYLFSIKNKNKIKIPEFIQNLTKEQINIFIEWTAVGDGSHNETGNWNKIAISSSDFLGEFLNLLLKNEENFSVYKQKTKNHYLNGKMIKTNKPMYIVSRKESNNTIIKNKYNHISTRKYNGKVYCVSVPNHTLLVERNGKFLWCGNSFMSPSCPSFPTPFEYILVFYKSSRKLIHKGESDLIKKEFIDWSLAIWNITGETRMKKFGHPAMFPKEIPKRLIKMFSYPGDVVLDPFSGLGTTCKVAKDLKRCYIGFETDEEYYKKSLERLNA